MTISMINTTKIIMTTPAGTRTVTTRASQDGSPRTRTTTTASLITSGPGRAAGRIPRPTMPTSPSHLATTTMTTRTMPSRASRASRGSRTAGRRADLASGLTGSTRTRTPNRSRRRTRRRESSSLVAPAT